MSTQDKFKRTKRFFSDDGIQVVGVIQDTNIMSGLYVEPYFQVENSFVPFRHFEDFHIVLEQARQCVEKWRADIGTKPVFVDGTL